MDPKELASLKPSPLELSRLQRRYRVLAPVFKYGTRPIVRYTKEGTKKIPKTGPLLVLANHVSTFDAPAINVLLGRPVIYLGSAGLLGRGMRARFLGGLGVIPKKKFMSDARAVRTLKRWADAGGAVGIFPEGERSWDGHTLPFVPGIEKLVRLLGAPVVTAQIHNGDRQWPRWAPRPRLGRVHIVFDEPIQFDRRTAQADILAHLKERIVLNPDQNRRWTVRGRRLAVGLPNLVYCCPSCGKMEQLVANGSQLGCRNCGRSWKVTTENTLIDRADGSVLTVARAAQLARDHFASHWVQDLARFEAEGVVMESEPLQLLDQGGDEPAEIGTGRLQLTSDALRLVGSDQVWMLPLRDIRSVSVEVIRGLWIMTSNGIYEPVMPEESVIKWRDALKHWMERAQSEPSAE